MTTKLFKIAFLISLFAIAVSAQDVADWSLQTDAAGKTLKAGDSIKVQLKADIDEGWHLYALDQPAGGPIPTTIKVADGSPFAIDGDITSPKPTLKADPNFIVDDKPIDTKFYEKTASFTIQAKATADTSADALGLDVRFQLCNDKFCLPPKTLKITAGGVEAVKKTAPASTGDQKEKPNFTTQPRSDDSIWGFIWLALTFGAISLLTPCVFPMIPITVSYFMKHSDGDRAKTIKLATVYSVGIIATFSLLGMALAVFLGAAGITLFAANPWVNLLIAAIFILFAFNLFGFYEIADSGIGADKTG